MKNLQMEGSVAVSEISLDTDALVDGHWAKLINFGSSWSIIAGESEKKIGLKDVSGTHSWQIMFGKVGQSPSIVAD